MCKGRPVVPFDSTTIVLALGFGALLWRVSAEAEMDRTAGVTSEMARAAIATPGDEVWVEREQLLMGTRLRIRLRATERVFGLNVIDEIISDISSYESLISSWVPQSELSRFNQTGPGTTTILSAGLLNLLSEAVAWFEETGGAFEPRVGALIDVWGIRDLGRVPTTEELQYALSSVGPGAIELDLSTGAATRKDTAAWIDAGGFGKGAALRAAAERLRARGVTDAFLDFGGQILVLGSAEQDQAGWPVFVAHPGRRQEPTTRLRLTEASVATSGASVRHLSVETSEISHIIDPRTGRPVPAWGSVTVVSEDPLTADAVATALFVLGPEEGLEWARDRSDLGALFSVLGKDGKVHELWNQEMEEWLERSSEGRVLTLNSQGE